MSMVIDNYGNIIEEPFHEKGWAIEVYRKYESTDGEYEWEYPWTHFRSYNKPVDVQRALKSLRKAVTQFEDWNVTVKYRPVKRIYRKIETGFHVEHLKDATDNIWWNQTRKPLKTLKAHEEGRITRL